MPHNFIRRTLDGEMGNLARPENTPVPFGWPCALCNHLQPDGANSRIIIDTTRRSCACEAQSEICGISSMKPSNRKDAGRVTPSANDLPAGFAPAYQQAPAPSIEDMPAIDNDDLPF